MSGAVSMNQSLVHRRLLCTRCLDLEGFCTEAFSYIKRAVQLCRGTAPCRTTRKASESAVSACGSESLRFSHDELARIKRRAECTNRMLRFNELRLWLWNAVCVAYHMSELEAASLTE